MAEEEGVVEAVAVGGGGGGGGGGEEIRRVLLISAGASHSLALLCKPLPSFFTHSPTSHFPQYNINSPILGVEIINLTSKNQGVI